jgi:aminopeptidase N
LLSSLPQGDETVIGFKGKKLGTFTYIYSPFSEEEINLHRWKDKRSIILYSPVTDVKKKKLFITFGEMFDVKKYQIDIDFKPRRSFISGKAIVEIESNVTNLSSVKFKLNPELDVLRIYDEERRELFFNRDKLRNILYVYFIRPPPQKKPYSLEIYYRGKIKLPTETADIVTGTYIHEGSDQNVTYDYVPSQPDTFLFSKRSNWYPSPPNDDDYFKARLRVIVPPKYQCVSNGELIEQSRLNEVEKVEEIETTGNSVYIFETKNPLKYISFIVGKFITVEEDFDSIPYRHFYAPGVSFQRKGLLNTAKNIVQFYESIFGLFPYEKLSIVRRPWTTTGGHSPASFIVINELYGAQDPSLLAKVGSPVDLSRWKEYFMAHEIAHQWWGQSITLKTYHDQWLSEGLAQFSSILYLKEKYGDGVFSYILKKFSQWSEKKSKWGPIILGARLSYHDFKAYQAIIYNKTALILNMLKDFLGEELFFQGLKEFFEKYKYGSASTHNFIKTFEEISGKDLTLFFKKWFYSWLLPEVKISHSLQEGEEGYILKLKITQLKDTFVFPLQIEWKENGEKVRKKILIDEKDEEFEFQLSAKPRKIKINPDKAVPGKFR